MGAITGWNLQELIEQVREMLAEPNEGFFPNTTIRTWLNRAQMDFQSRTKILTTITTMDSVASQRVYSLPDDYVRMQMVTYDGSRLRPGTTDELHAIAGSSTSLAEVGVPTIYYLRGSATSGLCLWLYKVPGTTGTEIELWYEQKPNELVTDTDRPLFDAEWQEALVLYAARLGHLKERRVVEARDLMAQYMDKVIEGFERHQRLEDDRPQVGPTDALWDEIPLFGTW